MRGLGGGMQGKPEFIPETLVFFHRVPPPPSQINTLWVDYLTSNPPPRQTDSLPLGLRLSSIWSHEDSAGGPADVGTGSRGPPRASGLTSGRSALVLPSVPAVSLGCWTKVSGQSGRLRVLT